MVGHLSDKDIDNYRGRMMSPGELFAANDHLSTCDACYRRFDSNYLEEAYKLAQSNLRASEDAGDDRIHKNQMAAFVEGKLSRQGSHMIAALRQKAGFRLAIQMACVAIVAGLAVWLSTLPMRSRLEQAGKTIQEQGSAIASMRAELGELRQQNAVLDRELKTSQDDLRNLQVELTRNATPSGAKATSSSPHIVLSVNDGDGVVTLDRSGRLSGLNPLSPSLERLVKAALTTGRVERALVLARLIERPRDLMAGSGGSDRYPLLNPVSTVVESKLPTFKWRAVDRATSYIISVYDSKENEVAASQPLRETEWTIPNSLKRGKVYTWHVRAIIDGMETKFPSPDMPNAKFKVLDRSGAQELERARRANPDSHIVLGILYACTGLLDDAQRELESVARANPQSRLAMQLLDSLRTIRGK